jgi:hypothetical protein
MKQKKTKSGSVKIDPKVLGEAKEYCKSNGLVVGFYTTEALKERLHKDKNVPRGTIQEG